MFGIKFIFVSACLIVVVEETFGHGMMMDPVSRSTAWRKNFGTPMNFNDNELFCGGADIQRRNGGKCGACGDNFSDRVPRNNENGGLYGVGKIVQTYKQGQRATVEVKLSANHLGNFEFAVCPLNGPNDVETDECFAKYPLQLANGGTKFPVKAGMKDFKIDIVLPQGLTCQHCSFRWHYKVGNSWGICEDGTTAIGCGNQETFRNCADVIIS